MSLFAYVLFPPHTPSGMGSCQHHCLTADAVVRKRHLTGGRHARVRQDRIWEEWGGDGVEMAKWVVGWGSILNKLENGGKSMEVLRTHSSMSADSQQVSGIAFQELKIQKAYKEQNRIDP